ncbi:flagellar M-ring protein FliF [Caulobacter sp. Root1455]|uniref:flagellar basal-body MS-ring/collar protein FliF n=1 Tax=unclassified Caulobacter TaxID=2648921 RepID=UPI0006F3473B|nr:MULTISPECIES: flagellar basal-body MS-ring/collar protein FliF [unclassified Caulobacter]KQY28885.1 flagellar M-ring protein FliF [Caulobacter sp. Root487D2Y]KQY99041.1 flagellar M-ring protein FliF [Caulobacter sp. Root1455]
MDKFLSAIQRFGVGRLAALVGVVVGGIAVIAAVMMMMSKQPNELLLSNVDPKESAAATQALDTAGIKYETKSDGSTIYVARDKVNAARQLIFTKGLVTSGSVGYEIFDTSSALGQTDFVQQLNRQRALQGELERTIQGWDGVRAARVHLVIPKRQLFEEDADKPTAAVTISTGREPSSDMVRAVQNLVAGSVAGMKPEAVNVIDQHGKTLSAGNDASLAGKLAQDAKSEAEARVAKTVKEMLDGVLGPGKARVTVNAKLDLNRVTVQERKFDPDGQVIRSESTNANNASETRNDDTGGVTSTQNIPGQTPNGFQPLGSKQDSNESVTNYEISESTKTTVQEPGSVIRQDVSVAIDGVTAPPGKDGKPGAYTPRSAAELAQLEQMVKTAVGFDATRGDQVSVVNVRFPQPEDQGLGKAGLLDGMDKNDIMRFAELAVLAVVALLILLFAVRPFLKSLMSPPPTPLGLALATPVTRMVTLSDGTTQEVVVDQMGETMAIAGPGSDMDQRIDIAKIEGQVKASSIKRVSEFVDRHPEESVAILRSWLHESE